MLLGKLVHINGTTKNMLVIVEGPSDANSLELYFSKFFDSNTVHMKIMYGDITSQKGINQSNIKARLGNEIKIYAQNNHFKASDVQQIIHLVDIDAFVRFIRESIFSQCTDYKDSWDYIKRNNHSLERNSNLGLCFI